MVGGCASQRRAGPQARDRLNRRCRGRRRPHPRGPGWASGVGQHEPMSTALVLAGGGVTGIAWETGVLAGLRDEGVDVVSGVRLVVGTSAGSTVGAQVLGGADLDDLVAAQLADVHHEMPRNLTSPS